jgi:hypothetical protein
MSAALALLVGLGLPALAPVANAAGLKCTGADGKSACTAAQVADLNQGIASGKRMHKPLTMVKEVTLGPNSTLQCTQENGSACTDEQLSEIMAVAASTHSAAGAFHITKSIDKASPML